MSAAPKPPAELDLTLPGVASPDGDETRVLAPGSLHPGDAPPVYQDDQATRAMPSTVPTPAPAADIELDLDETLVPGRTLVHQQPVAPAPPPRAPAQQPRPPTLPPASNPPSIIGQSGPLTFGSLTTGTSLPRSAPISDGQPRQVGRYQVVGRLGRGGMASVYRAHDPSIGRDVAIKFLHASLCEDDECRTRFLREARAAGALSHPNIVTVHDVGEIEGRPFMAMELLEGKSLADILEAQQLMSIRDVAMLGLQLARALEYAHARGVVHRDIKPGNIMLLGDKSGIKVTDFGIAHIEEAGMQQQTLVGSVLGTPQYMSPEQTRGEKLDGRSDLFSAGIVLYQALVGERPFAGDNMVAVAQQIANAEAPPIHVKRPDAPPALRRAIEKCLAKNPAQRWASGGELAAACRKVLDDIDSAEAEKQRPRIVPLRVKWALMMATIVAVVMGVAAFWITQRQYSALMAQASDYGAALTRFIAQQNAAAVLGEEWDVVDVAVQETVKTRNFERITVIDNTGVVRVSTLPGLAGQPYQPPAGAQVLGKLAGEVGATRYAGAPAVGAVLGFEAPVMYRDRQVGRVALGIPEQPLAEVARLSITLMIVLAVVTVLAVAVAMYFVANWFARPIKLVVDAMDELAEGRYTHRIGEQRKDEFGELFTAFDRLAGALQRRDRAAASAPGETAPGSSAPPQS
jgi:eukaryotic-like serine/threonine-protein kinase